MVFNLCRKSFQNTFRSTNSKIKCIYQIKVNYVKHSRPPTLPNKGVKDQKHHQQQQKKGWFGIFWDRLFGKYLLTTNIVSSGVLMMAGDLISQEIEYRRGLSMKRVDDIRVAQMFAVGCLQGPLHHYFYRWMDNIMPTATVKTSVYKILLDQFIISPICIMLFFYPACLLEGKNLIQSTTEIKAKFIKVYLMDWCIWPAAQFLNFYYLQPKYRVIYINLVTMLYNIFLSYVKHQEIEEGEEHFIFPMSTKGKTLD